MSEIFYQLSSLCNRVEKRYNKESYMTGLTMVIKVYTHQLNSSIVLSSKG